MKSTNPNLKTTEDLKGILSKMVDKLKGSLNPEEMKKFNTAMNDPSIKARVESKIEAIKKILKDDKAS